jgi:OOP family OmpA-OmpF porin
MQVAFMRPYPISMENRMPVHRKHGPRALATLQAALFLAAIPLMGCGPMIFSDATALRIAGTPPPPPPPPEVKEEPKNETVVVTKDAIVINDKIQFDYNKATIKDVSFELLDTIVKVIKENPHIKELSIEGHTDSDGKDKYNKKLSDKRASSVKKYLVEHGIDEAMLLSKGWGEEKPIQDNGTDEGKAANRRVEFLITKQERIKETVEINKETGERKVVETKAAPKSSRKPGRGAKK